MHSIAMVVRTSSCVLYAAKTSPSIPAIPRAAHTAMPHSTVTSFERYKTRHAFVSDRAGVDMCHCHEDHRASHHRRLPALQYHLDRSTPSSHGAGHVEENGDKVMRNNAKTTQNGVAGIRN
jgi:hypothetical protein